ncbi:MAG: DUF4339 domain-containing protein [Planctomycetes bacterium]|nr:DUF4339 domain-containing protein [Planctomycetota bacterium]
MTVQWFYSIGNEQSGPVTEIELKRLLQTGKVNRNSLVWKEGMAAWTPAGQVPGLVAGPPPLPSAPPPLHATPPAPRLRHTLRFESQVPKPVLAKPAAPPPIVVEPVVTSAPASEKPKPKPTRPALKVNDAVIAPFVLIGAIGLAVLSGLAGSPVGSLVFLFVALVCGVAFWVRVSIFLFNAWSVLAWKHQSIKPGLAAASPWIPVANLALIFKAVHGLSVKSNEALKEKGQTSAAPEPLGIAVGVAFVLMLLLPLALPNPGALLYFSTAVVALSAYWLIQQCRVTNILIGHEDAPSPSLGLRVGVLSSGVLSLLLAMSIGISSLDGLEVSGQPGLVGRQNIFGGSYQNPELQEMVRQEAMRNRLFSEQLRNIRNAYSGGRIQWTYPPQTSEEIRLRQLIEAETRRNAEFLVQLQQVSDAYQPGPSTPGLNHAPQPSQGGSNQPIVQCKTCNGTRDIGMCFICKGTGLNNNTISANHMAKRPNNILTRVRPECEACKGTGILPCPTCVKR